VSLAIQCFFSIVKKIFVELNTMKKNISIIMTVCLLLASSMPPVYASETKTTRNNGQQYSDQTTDLSSIEETLVEINKTLAALEVVASTYLSIKVAKIVGDLIGTLSLAYRLLNSSTDQ
jgi:hypothetical protein